MWHFANVLKLITMTSTLLQKRWLDRILRSPYFFLALLLHLIALILASPIVMFQATLPLSTTAAVFNSEVEDEVPPPPPMPPPPPEVSSAPASTQSEPSEPPTVTVPMLTTNEGLPDAFTVPNAEIGKGSASMTHLNLRGHGMGLSGNGTGPGPGLGQGTGGLGKLPGGGGTFFGVPAKGKRIAFLLDYSGSMSGEFREAMEKQLLSALSSLPQDTKVLIICWAGPAWLIEQTAPEILKKWKKVNTYDNFEIVHGASLESPRWRTVDDGSVNQIISDLKKQVAAKGGTDWRQPFRYVMRADPQPDVIFFLTDGQIPAESTDRALTDITKEMNKALRAPQVNCLWIENKRNGTEPMQKLAKMYNGEFRKVSTKDVER
jgi:uncharacterized protein YegL